MSRGLLRISTELRAPPQALHHSKTANAGVRVALSAITSDERKRELSKPTWKYFRSLAGAALFFDFSALPFAAAPPSAGPASAWRRGGGRGARGE